MATAMRDTLAKLEPMLGYWFKVVEIRRSKLGSILSNKNPWTGSMCGRKHCHPCKQETEKVEPCSRQKIVYESRCVQCNENEKGMEEQELEDKRMEPSIYVG